METMKKYRVAVYNAEGEEVVSTELEEDMIGYGEAYKVYRCLSSCMKGVRIVIECYVYNEYGTRYIRTDIEEEKTNE